MDIIKKAIGDEGLTGDDVRQAVAQSLDEYGKEYGKPLEKVLIIPPDITRIHSGAGSITAEYFKLLKGRCAVDIMPALGTHDPMTEQELRVMFGEEIPLKCFITHNWKRDIVKIGEVPGSFISEVSEGLVDDPINVEINKRLIDGSYDLIISIGQVVPHEVIGMANYSKNIFVGCGGSSMINSTHMLGAIFGMERIMGRDHSPVRKVLDYAEERFLKDVPLLYVLTVTTSRNEDVRIHGLFIGRDRKLFEDAVSLSQQKNLIFVDKSFRKAVVYLDPKEFKSTWLGNKAIYRTRMAIGDGGELIVIAPGVRKFGEDEENDRLIRKYGYIGRHKVLELVKKEDDLKRNFSVAAHLIHGSSDGRFSITYAAPLLTREEVEGVNFCYMPYDECILRYDPKSLTDGHNILANGEEVFFIKNPALGLWVDRNRFC